jgi:phage I-like protein
MTNPKKMTIRRSVLATALVLGIVSCASLGLRKMSPLQTAEFAYIEASFGYDAALTAVENLRGAHLIDDPTWNRAEAITATVRAVEPQVRVLLSTWRSTAFQPPELQAKLDALTGAVTQLQAIQTGATPAAGVKP